MLKTLRLSLKDSLVYGIGNIAVKIVGLVLIPLYTDPEYFSVDEFGTLALLDITGLILLSILASGLPQSLMRWYWDKDHKPNQPGIFFMTLTSQLIISFVLCILLIPLSGTFSEVLFRKSDWSGVISLVILASALQSVNNIISTLMRLQSRSVLYTVTNLVKLGVVLFLTLYFIIVRKTGLEGIYLAQVIGNGFYIIISARYTVSNARPFFDPSLLKEMNLYGFPLMLANIAAVMLNVIDRFTLNSLTVLKFVAIYTLALKITSVLKLAIVDSVKLALGPLMFKKMDAPDNMRFYSKALLYSSYVLMTGIVAFSLFSYEITSLITMSDEYLNGVALVPVLALSVFFINMREITVYGLHFAKKTKIIGAIVVIATILSLILNLILVRLWDMTGAAIATIISQSAFWYACYYFSQKAFYIPYEIRKISVMLITGASLSFLSLILNELQFFPRLLLKICALVSFPFILNLFQFYEPAEIQAVKGFIRKWMNISRFRQNINTLKHLSDDF